MMERVFFEESSIIGIRIEGKMDDQGVKEIIAWVEEKSSQHKKLRIYAEIKDLDGFVKSPKPPFPVIPVKTGIQEFHALLDSRLRGSDDLTDFLRMHQ
jgi:hypothetical protein